MSFSQSSLKGWLAANRVLVIALFCGILLPMIVFGKIADEVVEREALGFDRPLQMWAHSYATANLDQWMLGLSMLGSPPLMFLICGVIVVALWRNRRHGDAWFFIAAIVGAGLLNQAAKMAFSRPRPELWLVIDPRSDYSFPSGHAMGTMALYAAIVVLLWHTKWRVPWIIGGAALVFLVGLSRVYLSMHYPSDVLCGWLASLSWVVGLDLIRRARRPHVAPSSTR
jgi:membrane-associated phospholipid phosphatase